METNRRRLIVALAALATAAAAGDALAQVRSAWPARMGDGTRVAGPHPAYGFTDLEAGAAHATTIARRTAPVRWLPAGPLSADESAGRLVGGPFDGQIVRLADDRRHLVRVVPDVADGVGQGCTIRFAWGLPATRVRGIVETDQGQVCLASGPAKPGERHLHVIEPTGVDVFDLLDARATSAGVEIVFTQPIDEYAGWDPNYFTVRQWPQDDPDDAAAETLDVTATIALNDRVMLDVAGLQPDRIVHVRVHPTLRSTGGDALWTTEAWITLDRIPTDRPNPEIAPPVRPLNELTAEEKADGWRMLFDGHSTLGWRGFGKPAMPDGWQPVDGALTRVAPGGDILTHGQYENFELALEWRIAAGGNSGIFYRVRDKVRHSGPEMQVLDNQAHADSADRKRSAGSCYDMYAPVDDLTAPIGSWNRVRIVARGPHIEHWLNGIKAFEYEIGSPEWLSRLYASKYRRSTTYGREKRGHILLQDHGDPVAYRNIRIRPLPASIPVNR
jgi:cytochrome c